MEAYRYSELVDVIAASKKGLSPTVPVHLFGAGHPMMFALAVALGCDLFDSAAYALIREGRAVYYCERDLPCGKTELSALSLSDLFKIYCRGTKKGRQ